VRCWGRRSGCAAVFLGAVVWGRAGSVANDWVVGEIGVLETDRTWSRVHGPARLLPGGGRARVVGGQQLSGNARSRVNALASSTA
jgi:hypothetical protein